MLTGGEDVVANQPVAGHNLIEPGETALVGMASVAMGLEDVAELRRSLDLRSVRPAWDGRTNALKQREDQNCGKGQPANCFHHSPISLKPDAVTTGNSQLDTADAIKVTSKIITGL
jgi:hypothetical protein